MHKKQEIAAKERCRAKKDEQIRRAFLTGGRTDSLS